MSQILSYNNSLKIKEKYVSRMKNCIDAHELIQDVMRNNDKDWVGLFILDKCDNKSFSDELQLDLWIPKLLERIFKGMKLKMALKFSLYILQTIPVGIDKSKTDMIKVQLIYYALTEILPKKYQVNETAKIISIIKDTLKGITMPPQLWADVSTAAYGVAATDKDADTAMAFYSTGAAADGNIDAVTYCVADINSDKQLSFDKMGNKLIELFQEYKN